MTTHYEKIQVLGNRMASNLETMGVSASFGDGGLTLADKILQIQHFTDGLLLWADKDIIQTGDTVNFCALLLEDKKAVSGETVFFYDLNNPPITRSSAQTHTLNVELGSSFKLIYQSSSTYGEGINLSNEDDSLLINYNGYNNNIYISINGGVPVTAFSCEGFLKLENGVLSDDGGHTYNLSSYNLNFKLKEMQTVGNNCSVYINPIGSAVTDANGVASVTYTGVGAGKLNVQTKTSDGMLQSERYDITDAYNTDDGTTSNTDWLTNSNLTITPSANGKTVQNNTSLQQAWDLNKHGTSTSTTYDFTLPLVVEMDIVSMTGEVRFMITDSSSHTDRIDLTNIADKHLKIEFKDDKYRYYLNGEQIGTDFNNTITGDCRFRIILTGNASFTFKNFIVYPI